MYKMNIETILSANLAKADMEKIYWDGDTLVVPRVVDTDRIFNILEIAGVRAMPVILEE
jgi:hypothetical protein